MAASTLLKNTSLTTFSNLFNFMCTSIFRRRIFPRITCCGIAAVFFLMRLTAVGEDVTLPGDTGSNTNVAAAMPADPMLSFESTRTIPYSADGAQSRDAYAWHFNNSGQPSKKYVNGVSSGQNAGSTNSGTRVGMLNVDCSSVLVGVLDSGMNTNHPDLKGVLYTNTSSGTVDISGHGTRVIGLIAAKASDVGSRGVAAGCKLALGRVENFAPLTIVPVLSELVAMNPRVINCSWGTPRSNAELKEVFRQAHAKGIIMVCSAQNSQVNYDKGLEDYPTKWKAEFDNIITVFCEMPDGKNLPGASATGTNWIDFGSPGWALPAPDLNDGYSYANGTSEAAAVATGVAALLIAQHPEESYKQIISRMRYTVHASADPNAKATISGGCLDAYAASVMEFPKLAMPEKGMLVVNSLIAGKPYVLQTSQDMLTWNETPFTASSDTAEFSVGEGFYRLRLPL